MGEHSAQEEKRDETSVGKDRARIKNASFVLLVAHIQDAVDFYEGIGFTTEDIGGHIHVSHGGATFILHEAANPSDIRPCSSAEGGVYFDAFCYTDKQGLRQLYDLFIANHIEIARGPIWSEGWSELTIRDNNGYCIAFGA
ncbi:VOC family protein [Paenibacillus sacheonensis]|uniref:Bleomycin resistance protein n=1 Tax=Paenibacillus sacheonensis TaxID=742054 RepID=A0A7X4YPD9_9BACL|nr:VOC family protein [Paenibacillus sacheonensis]MBM7564754.1 hypothetical protein [Paenibacillus sacheonensis]NBC69306.1 bleomycin resistance protein [Paenibacillus sacheonensis]